MVSRQVGDERVNIYEFPDAAERFPTDQGTQITIGDLHGNTIKLLFLLVKHGVVTNLSKEDYENLVNIYRHFSAEDADCKGKIQTFRAIVDKMEFTTAATIRLIGDELADRGKNDYFTLYLLSAMKKNQVPFEILLSNHSADFLVANETVDDYRPPVLQNEHAKSMVQLDELVKKGILDRDEIDTIADSAWKPALRLISYTLSADPSEGGPGITIYSHAGMGLDEIRALARKFEVEYNEKIPSDLGKTIDEINKKFNDLVSARRAYEILDPDVMRQGYWCAPIDSGQYPVEFILWNREYSHLNRPESLNGFGLRFVHGHDSSDPGSNNTHIFNLDDPLGKNENSFLGSWRVLCSHEIGSSLSFSSSEPRPPVTAIPLSMPNKHSKENHLELQPANVPNSSDLLPGDRKKFNASHLTLSPLNVSDKDDSPTKKTKKRRRVSPTSVAGISMILLGVTACLTGVAIPAAALLVTVGLVLASGALGMMAVSELHGMFSRESKPSHPSGDRTPPDDYKPVPL